MLYIKIFFLSSTVLFWMLSLFHVLVTVKYFWGVVYKMTHSRCPITLIGVACSHQMVKVGSWAKFTGKWRKVWVQEPILLWPSRGIWSCLIVSSVIIEGLRTWLPSCFPALKFCDSDWLLYPLHALLQYWGVIQLNIHFTQFLPLLFWFTYCLDICDCEPYQLFLGLGVFHSTSHVISA